MNELLTQLTINKVYKAERSGVRLGIEGLLVQASPPAESLCFLERCLVLVQPRKACSNITEKLLTGTYHKESKQIKKHGV